LIAAGSASAGRAEFRQNLAPFRGSGGLRSAASSAGNPQNMVSDAIESKDGSART